MAALAFFKAVGTDKYMTVAATTIVAFDHLITFPAEVRAVWKTRRTVASAMFIINRYLSLAGYIVVTYFQCVYQNLTTLERCTRFSTFIAVLGLANQVAIVFTMTLRIYALYQRSTIILLIMCISGLYCIAVLFYVIFCITSIVISFTFGDHEAAQTLVQTCVTTAAVFPYVLAITSVIQFDVVVFIFTAARTWHTLKSKPYMRSASPLYSLIFRDGCVYFIIMIVANAFPFIYFWVDSEQLFTREMGANWVIGPAISVILLSRLMLNLRLENECTIRGDLHSLNFVPSRILFAPRILGNLTAELRTDMEG